MPREYHGHNVQHQVCRQHDRRIKVKKNIQINTISLYLITSPGLVEGPALEEVNENGRETEAKSDEVHDVDADAVGAVFAHDFGVE